MFRLISGRHELKHFALSPDFSQSKVQKDVRQVVGDRNSFIGHAPLLAGIVNYFSHSAFIELLHLIARASETT